MPRPSGSSLSCGPPVTRFPNRLLARIKFLRPVSRLPPRTLTSFLRYVSSYGQLRLPLRLYDHPVHITLTFLLIVIWGLLPVPLAPHLILAWAGIPVSQTCQTSLRSHATIYGMINTPAQSSSRIGCYHYV